MLRSQTKRIGKYVGFRALSTNTGYLVDDPKFSFLKDDLKLERVNPGAYNGKWFGSGPAVQSIGKYQLKSQAIDQLINKALMFAQI